MACFPAYVAHLDVFLYVAYAGLYVPRSVYGVPMLMFSYGWFYRL